MTASFQAAARARYVAANIANLRWLLQRRRFAPFLDTRFNAVQRRDYEVQDGWRGPDFVSGWIQGRGLESLVRHAAFFAETAPGLARDLLAAARPLEAELSRLIARDGAAFAIYRRADLQPVRPDAEDRPVAQTQADGLRTFAEIFVWKGLFAARAAFGASNTDEAARALAGIARDIEADRFLIDEKVPIGSAALAAQSPQYGPRMIMVGAAALLAEHGQHDAADFAVRFVEHVLARHACPDRPGVLLDTPGEDRVNPGHAAELVGFALEYVVASGGREASAMPVDQLVDVLIASYRAGRRGPGLPLYLSARTGELVQPWFPWWPLPEAIRAAALAHAHTGRADALAIWRDADAAFFANYWLGDPAIGYQTLDANGPIDYVPATPDLDPGYHTGLSLLTVIRAIDAMA